jgi:hypothetical protein
MNNYIKPIVYVLLLSFLVSCDNTRQQVEDLQATVIEVHDEVMPKMDDLMKLKSKLNVIKVDSINLLTTESRVTANNLISSLNTADEGMMNWMRNYDSMMQGMSEEEKLAYLIKQEVSIKKVKQDMLSAIAGASEFIADHKK